MQSITFTEVNLSSKKPHVKTWVPSGEADKAHGWGLIIYKKNFVQIRSSGNTCPFHFLENYLSKVLCQKYKIKTKYSNNLYVLGSTRKKTGRKPT